MKHAEDSALAGHAGEPVWLGSPRVPEWLVIRHRLLHTLKAATRRPVTLICAGAGWGKTALVVSWARADPGPGPVAWLTLESRHDDPDIFWTDLLIALGGTGAAQPGVPDGRPMDRVTARIAELPARTLLVLDDVHVLRAPPVLDGLQRLLLSRPDQLGVVVIARTEPTVELHRLRLAGDLIEIRRPQLAFRLPEAAELLTRDGIPPSPERITELVARTEGWPVALALMADSDSTWPSGVPDTVRDYLFREVIDLLPPATQRFLLQTSLAQDICGDLAEAMTGEPNGEQVLELLERSNAFVSRTYGSAGQWFRYHGLLRDVLRHEAGVREPRLVAEWHVRAARWYAAQGSLREALDHAAAARDWTFFGQLVVGYALPMVVSRHRGALLDLVREVPQERLADTPELAMCAALLLLTAGNHAAVRDQLARVRAEQAQRVPTKVAADVMGVVLAARLDCDMPRLIEDASYILAELAEQSIDRLPSLLQYRAIALSFKGVGLLWMGRLDAADRYLWSSSTAARAADVELVEIGAQAHLALLVYLQGSLREAERYVYAVDDLARRRDLGLTAEWALAHLTQALIELERNRITQAQEALRRGLHAAGDQPDAVLRIVAALVRAQLLLASDDPAAAQDLLRTCRAHLRPPLVAPLLDRWLTLAESEAGLAQGEHADVVRRYAGRAAGETMPPAEQVLLARAYELSGEYEAAEDLAGRVREGPDTVSAVSAWVVTALIADARGLVRQSADALARAVLRAEIEGIRRPFRKFDSARITVLAERQRWLYEAIGPVRGDVTAEVTPVASMAPLPPQLDMLSQRERDVLRYLPTVLTASEIATDLKISVNTVKAHMRSIYRKLGAARRREAVVQARQNGLL